VGKRSIIVGSRGSKLALLQTELVVQRLRESYHDLEFHIKRIKTSGDRYRTTSLAEIGGQGIFIKELEEALLSGEIDMAVHSLKDMPTELSSAFKLAAVGMRIDARDAFLSKSGKPLSEMPAGACVGTGSERRAVQLRAYRPDIQIRPLRGNIDTRLSKLYSGELEGIIVAAAAMLRMGWGDRITEYLPIELFLPSVGQGALAVEIGALDQELSGLLSVVNDEPTWQSVQAERAFLSALGGGCRAPIAALGTVADNSLHLEGMVASSDGSRTIRAAEHGAPADSEKIGKLLAEKLLSLGARELIARKADEGNR
jgi:hydroxymethylbilane synthase